MNRKQAKLRFTELTGLPAKDKSVFPGIWQHKGKVEDWYNYAWSNGHVNRAKFDSRYKDFWVSLVTYLESLGEVS
jgi:hypothetical protein